ncbi:VOC family protein [Ureibacillus sp. NPDC094379]
MSLQFDHIVHYVFAPKDITRELSDVGIQNRYGGEHDKGGTFNTLSYFGLKYIEYLGIKDDQSFEENIPNIEKYSLLSNIVGRRGQEGFITMALRSHNLHDLANSLREKGVTANGPFPLSRKTPEGTILSWELLYAGVNDLEIPLPFFIDWGVTDEERRKDLIEVGHITNHPKGNLEISTVIFAVSSFEKSFEKWKTYLSLEEIEFESHFNEKVECRTLALGDTNLQFVKPIGEGPIQSFISEQGPGIYQLQFSGVHEQKDIMLHNANYKFL